ncbi:MAG: ATP-binding cassette domain-containing protein [Candidatus Riflebacteria bacterium]|nr:ATP-binding cassette domain-containing protein [Candidatus Riflebacteria bacterium]
MTVDGTDRTAAAGGEGASGPAPCVLEARGVGKVYHPASSRVVVALDRVSQRFEAGGLHVIWGPSGCGKTTLLSLLGGLDMPTTGEVLVDGTPLDRLSEPELSLFRRRRVGFLFQNSNLLAGVPLWANVSLSMVPDGISSASRRAAAGARLAELGLEDLGDRTPEELSGGEVHRAALARALVRDPDILLADEPTSQIDEANAAGVMAVLDRLARAGKVVVVASHDRFVREAARWVTELKSTRRAIGG